MKPSDFQGRLGVDTVESPCPQCDQKNTVTYNGNYYCLQCEWCLPEGEYTSNEVDIVRDWLTKTAALYPENRSAQFYLDRINEEYPEKGGMPL